MQRWLLSPMEIKAWQDPRRLGAVLDDQRPASHNPASLVRDGRAVLFVEPAPADTGCLYRALKLP